jgi:hypothetical protein
MCAFRSSGTNSNKYEIPLTALLTIIVALSSVFIVMVVKYARKPCRAKKYSTTRCTGRSLSLLEGVWFNTTCSLANRGGKRGKVQRSCAAILRRLVLRAFDYSLAAMFKHCIATCACFYFILSNLPQVPRKIVLCISTTECSC